MDLGGLSTWGHLGRRPAGEGKLPAWVPGLLKRGKARHGGGPSRKNQKLDYLQPQEQPQVLGMGTRTVHPKVSGFSPYWMA